MAGMEKLAYAVRCSLGHGMLRGCQTARAGSWSTSRGTQRAALMILMACMACRGSAESAVCMPVILMPQACQPTPTPPRAAWHSLCQRRYLHSPQHPSQPPKPACLAATPARLEMQAAPRSLGALWGAHDCG